VADDPPRLSPARPELREGLGLVGTEVLGLEKRDKMSALLSFWTLAAWAAVAADVVVGEKSISNNDPPVDSSTDGGDTAWALTGSAGNEGLGNIPSRSMPDSFREDEAFARGVAGAAVASVATGSASCAPPSSDSGSGISGERAHLRDSYLDRMNDSILCSGG